MLTHFARLVVHRVLQRGTSNVATSSQLGDDIRYLHEVGAVGSYPVLWDQGATSLASGGQLSSQVVLVGLEESVDRGTVAS